MIREVQRHIERALNGIRLAFRGKLTRNNSGQPIQLAQVAGLADELLQNVELMQHYGITSNPPAGSECVVLPLGGRTGHGIVIATEHGSYRLKNLKPGEVALYSDEGDSVILKRGRVMEVTTQTLNVSAATVVNIASPTVNINAQTAVNITSPTVTLSGNLSVGGTITAVGNISSSGGNLLDSSGKTMASIRTVYNGHTHADPQGGSVAAPGAQM
ncbi:MAG: phage baseplate assembly protein V [Pseudomonadota bacterium]